MCQRPSGISIDTRIDDTGVQFTINVDPADYGYIVGKQGRNMRAIRTLAGCMAKRYRTRFEVVLDFPRPTN
jgi:predicted RNA-binding protein YlqC (UPF0109 family)